MAQPLSPNTPLADPGDTDEEMLAKLQREAFEYFLVEVNPTTGLIADKNQPGSPSSIAVTGMALTAYLIGVERKFLTRDDAIKRVLKILRFFNNSRQGKEIKATGYKGFYYHFLDMNSGERVWNSELSTVDTALFIAGALSVAGYFSGDSENEKEIRSLADQLYRRVDWQWALNKQTTITHGWKPRSGFLRYRWSDNYSEAILLYVLALGSPTFPIDPIGYKEWTDTFSLTNVYDIDYLYAGPLFVHQFSHQWIDFRGIRDSFNNKVGFDYFENSKRATYVHRQYAIENQHDYQLYGEYCWGFTASNGPGRVTIDVDGKKRIFYDYISRGAPFGPDDGTVSPWAVVASLPFAPEIVIPTMRHAIEELCLKTFDKYGLEASFNACFPEKNKNPLGWVSPWQFGLNQAPIVMMIENYRSELIWKIMRECPYIVNGLRMAGFSGGWLGQ